jgi:hypothetical protein
MLIDDPMLGSVTVENPHITHHGVLSVKVLITTSTPKIVFAQKPDKGIGLTPRYRLRVV